MLEKYAQDFGTVELNTTFYRLPSPAAVRRWRERTPPSFLFAAKMSRLATHFHKLGRPEADVPAFLERMAALGDKLGPVLVQLPPSLGRDLPRLDAFLAQFPRRQRVAVEFRGRDWLSPATYRLLEERSCALCLTDGPGGRTVGPATADFTYVRMHGRDGPAYDYPDEEIGEWLDRLRSLPVEEAFVYWNNDLGGAAVRNAQRMKAMALPSLFA